MSHLGDSDDFITTATRKRGMRTAAPIGYSDVPPMPAAIPVADESWKARANCAGLKTDMFFPGRGDSTRAAVEVCRGCEVREECLTWALDEGLKFGIFGGLSERQRRRLRRTRSAA